MQEVLPVANELDPVAGRDPDRAASQDGGPGLLRDPHPRGVRRPRSRCLRVRGRRGGVGASLDERGQHHRPWPAVHRGLRRRAAGAVPAAHGPGRVPQRLRALRGGRRVRRGEHSLPGGTGRGRLADHRPEDVVHVRRRLRLPPGVRPHRPPSDPARRSEGITLLPDAEGAWRAAPGRDRKPGPQDRLPRLEDLGAVLRRAFVRPR